MGMMQKGMMEAEAPEQEMPPAAPAPEAKEPEMEAPGEEPAEEEADDEGGDIATPEEQAEYERGLAGIYDALYRNEGASKAVIDMIQPEDKIGSVVKAVVLLIEQVDKKLQLDEAVIAQLTEDTVDRVVELAETAKQIQYSDKEQQAVMGAAFEGVLQVFGASPEDAQEFMASMPPEKVQQHQAQYDQMVASSGADPGPTAPTTGAPSNG